MPDSSAPRVALLGFSIECNKFAPPATKAHFVARTYLEGEAIVAEARSPTPTMLPETPGFVAAMDAAGPWQPVGIALAMTEPNGPVEHAFFVELLDTITPPAASSPAGRCRLHLLARRRADDRGRRPRWGSVRDGAGDRRARMCRSPQPWTCTPMSRTEWSSRSTSSSATAPIRISTCASAAPRPPPRSARCWAASGRNAPSSACRSCRRP